MILSAVSLRFPTLSGRQKHRNEGSPDSIGIYLAETPVTFTASSVRGPPRRRSPRQSRPESAGRVLREPPRDL